MGKSKTSKKNMLDVTKNYEEFIKGREFNANNEQLFDKVIKKAVKPKPKQRGLK